MSDPPPAPDLVNRQKFLGISVKAKPPGFALGKIVPETNASWPSRILFTWLTPLLMIGYTRPIELADLWNLPAEWQATPLGTSLERKFFSRVPNSRRPNHLRSRFPAANSNLDADTKDEVDLESGGGGAEVIELPVRNYVVGGTQPISALEDEGKVGTLPEVEFDKEGKPKKSLKVEEGGKVYDQSLLRAVNQLVLWRFWSAGLLAFVGFTLTTTSPLVAQRLLQYIQRSYASSHGSGAPSPSIGVGIGYAFGLWAIQQLSSLIINQYHQQAMGTGFMVRSALISAISRKSIRLSGEASIEHPKGKLVTLISADASFFDWAALLAHDLWIQPLQITIGLAILCTLLGYSALVGFAVIVVGTPLQGWLTTKMIGTRQQQMKITDQRVRLLQEVLQGIRVIKLMAYEGYFSTRISELRRQELNLLVKNCLIRATMVSTMAFIPVLGAVLSFITYALSGHNLSPATIFASLAAFNNVRDPLFVLPMAFHICSDAYVALGRISGLLLAQEQDQPIPVDENAPFAVSAHADYSWNSAEKPVTGGAIGVGGLERGGAKKETDKAAALAKAKKLAQVEQLNEKPSEPFQLKDINVDIPRSSFVVVCGRVGSGKSSLVQALIGEMKMTRGSSYLGGSISYFPQAPWVQNATIRDNILFGDPQPDEVRFTAAVRACALEPDLAILAHGLETEIGERGINLSGGQKARVCLARAVYSNADIALLDDPLSAVDAHVSKLLVDCLTTGPLAKKTRILVTHHLEVLPQADLIITMLDGKIAEIGPYSELMNAEGALSKLVAEHVSESRRAQEEEEEIVASEDQEIKIVEDQAASKQQEEAETKKEETAVKSDPALMTKEERETGAVSGRVYSRYLSSMGALWRAPLFLSCMLLAQVSNVGNTVLLGLWSESSIQGWSRAQYMGTYAALGLGFSIFTFSGTLLLFTAGVSASFNLFQASFSGVVRSPVSWHDRTPVGRIVSRLSKDITVMDNQLPMVFNNLLTQGLSILGTIALVFYVFPYLGIIFVPLFLFYYVAAAFYAATSREVKRVDSIVRSFVYSSFGEMLSGLPSVRAYHVEERFLLKTEKDLDDQNRCYFVTFSLQQWLTVSLDLLGNVLVLGIALFGVAFRNTVSPGKLGIVLTYALTLTRIFSSIVNVYAQLEQSMNTAERVLFYASLTPEAATHTKDDPPADWPSKGAVEFENVSLRYREELPLVLKGASFSIKAGEKVGIVGRTGAGKSSLLQALFRIVELAGGKISIDGYNIRVVGLDILRSRLGIVPQDPLLWSGTVRDNLDPTNMHTDADLISSLRRCNLVASDDASVEVKARLDKFRLDAVVQDEGSNFSTGERQLMALARVVVRNSRIIVLDEATSSVDVETDVAIQNTIRTEFTDQSLITIAHRLSTIAFYDRVIVMDAGVVAEIGPPLELFDLPDSAFRSMCDKASLSREDIFRIRGRA